MEGEYVTISVRLSKKDLKRLDELIEDLEEQMYGIGAIKPKLYRSDVIRSFILKGIKDHEIYKRKKE